MFGCTVWPCRYVQRSVLPGLQDCSVLGDIVAREPDSIDAALERYERQRKPDVHALGTMDHQVTSRINCHDRSLNPTASTETTLTRDDRFPEAAVVS